MQKIPYSIYPPCPANACYATFANTCLHKAALPITTHFLLQTSIDTMTSSTQLLLLLVCMTVTTVWSQDLRGASTGGTCVVHGAVAAS